MRITHYIKNLLNNSHRKQFEGIKKLPAEEQVYRVGEIFYEECVRKASGFITGELRRKDSPFSAVSREKFFHEIMAVTMWLLDKTFEGKKRLFMDRIINMYSDYFKFSPALDSQALRCRYSIYYESWNDVTGHQDIFGQMAAEKIFGESSNFSLHQSSFWIITYAYDTMNEFENLARQCRNMKIKLSIPHENI